MIVLHNNSDPSSVGELSSSTIVRSDGRVPSKYKAYHVSSTVTWPDPTAWNEESTKNVNNLSDARHDIINNAKYPDLAIGCPSSTLLKYVSKSGESNLLVNSPFGNWRDYTTNGFCQISDRIILNPSELKFGNGVSYEVQNIKSLLGKGVMGFVKTAMDTANAVGEALGMEGAESGEYLSKFQNVPVTSAGKAKTTGLTKLTFKFKFGQAQMFSAEEEVVKPIIALATLFMPKQSGSNRISLPFMTDIRARTKMAKAVLDNLDIKGLLGGVADFPNGADIVAGNASIGGGDRTLLEGMNDFASRLYATVDNAAMEALAETVTLIVRIGGMVTGPYVAKGVKWDFDFSDVDEFGYPCSGEITFDGLSQVFINCGGDIIRQWGYSTGETSPFLPDSAAKNTELVSYGDEGMESGSSTERERTLQ